MLVVDLIGLKSKLDVNFNSLRKLINMNHIPTFKIDNKHKCETCVKAKLTRSSFQSIERNSEPLDLREISKNSHKIRVICQNKPQRLSFAKTARFSEDTSENMDFPKFGAKSDQTSDIS